LAEVLERAQRLGFLGPGPVADHLRHAEGFVAATTAPGQALDLGSGAGVPGLALAMLWPDSHWILLDANERRGALLEQAVAELDLIERVTVVTDRAERAARDERWRGALDLVVARSFGPPAVTAECASGFLRVGGQLLVSEPPIEDDTRWPATPLAELGLTDRGQVGPIRVLEQLAAASEQFPRRVGMPGKRPLW
jgi:16S rRNA (guanine527-N7)-methyltransferase